MTFTYFPRSINYADENTKTPSVTHSTRVIEYMKQPACDHRRNMRQERQEPTASNWSQKRSQQITKVKYVPKPLMTAQQESGNHKKSLCAWQEGEKCSQSIIQRTCHSLKCICLKVK